MKQFEYKVISVHPSGRNQYRQDPIKLAKRKLNELGLDGYELVTITNGIAYLKKEAPGLSLAQHRELLTKKAKRAPRAAPQVTVPDNDSSRTRWPFKRGK